MYCFQSKAFLWVFYRKNLKKYATHFPIMVLKPYVNGQINAKLPSANLSAGEVYD